MDKSLKEKLNQEMDVLVRQVIHHSFSEKLLIRSLIEFHTIYEFGRKFTGFTFKNDKAASIYSISYFVVNKWDRIEAKMSYDLLAKALKLLEK